MSDSQFFSEDDSLDSTSDDNSSKEFSQADLRVNLPNDLPPVEPPSAGMIIQLFLVPAIIVAVIIGVYAAFGQIASQELDWRQLVTDVKSENPHVRWRGALGLAQMLDADAQRGEESQQLASNPEIATALSDLYAEYLPLSNLSEEELKNIEFLSIALGRMTAQDVIVPVFRSGMDESKDRHVRKHSLIGLCMLAGNVQAAGVQFTQPDLVDELIEISKESDQLFRHQAAFALGLIPSENSRNRLMALLNDPNLMTRTNAAIGLSRNQSPEGLPTLFEILKSAQDWQLDPTQVVTEEQRSTYFEHMLILINSVKAIHQNQDLLTPEQKSKLVQLLDRLSEQSRDTALKSQIIELTQKL